MHLVMFDIDGTLTETMKVDEECFVRSFKDVFGFADLDIDWSHYPHTTDSGIFHDVFTSRIGRSPTAQEVSRFRQHFIQLLAAASSQSPFAPVAGADRLLSRLAQGGSHRVSLATGGWRDSARLKMASAGMCFDDHPTASADDALDRASIMRISMQRAAERYGKVGNAFGLVRCLRVLVVLGGFRCWLGGGRAVWCCFVFPLWVFLEVLVLHGGLTMRCSERRRAVAVAIGAPRGRRR